MKLKKSETLEMWRGAPEAADIASIMQPIPYKHKGKTYGMDGVRIDGSPEFIRAVLGRLKPLMALENSHTRLATHVADCSEVDAKFNKGNGGHVCYIRAHVRGSEAQHMRTLYPGAFADC